MTVMIFLVYRYISKSFRQSYREIPADLFHLIGWYIFLPDILLIDPYVVLNHNATSWIYDMCPVTSGSYFDFVLSLFYNVCTGVAAPSAQKGVSRMKYTLLIDFLPTDSYDGEAGSDTHGKYILFPAEVRNNIRASDFLRTPSGDLIQIIEEARQDIDGVPHLKLYYG